MTTSILPHSTTGTMNVWGGTRDGKDGYIDYKLRTSNLIPPYEIKITAQDVRHLQPQLSFQTNGYELLRSPTALPARDLIAGGTPEGKKLIEDVYLEECRRLVEGVAGGPSVVIPTSFRVRDDFDSTVRSVPKMSQRSVKSDGPRPLAHVDRDPTTAMHVLRGAVGGERAEELVGTCSRWAQVNVWRPIGNVAQRWPLAFLSHDSIPDWDYDKYTGRVYNYNDPRVENRGEKSYDTLLKEDPRYVYSYASNMTPEEAWVFSSFDSDRSMCHPHGAFWDDNTPLDAPPRRSIEARMMVFW